MSEKVTAATDPPAALETTILRGSGLTLAGTAVGGAVAFFNEILLARSLGASTYGLFSLALVLARIAHGLSLFGLQAAILHYLPIHRRDGRSDQVAGTILATLLLPAALALAASGLLRLLAPWLANDVFGKPAAEVYIRLLAIAVPLMAMSEVLALLARGLGYARYYVLVSTLTPPLVLLALLLLIHAAGAGPYWICRAVGAAYGTAAVIGLLCVLSAAGPEVRRTRPRFAFGALYRYGFPVLLGTSLYLVMEWADILLLGRFVAADEVGVYRACVQICTVFDMIIFATNLAAVHVFPVLEHERRFEERNQTFRQVTLIILLLSAPVFLLLTLHAKAALALLGPKFANGATALLILATGRLLRNGLGTAAFVLILSGRQATETRNAAAASATNLALNLALIPLFGLIGAAVATTAAEIALNLLRVWLVRRLMQLHAPWRLLLRMVLVGGAATLLLALAHRALGSDQASPIGLLVAAGLDGILLLAALWLFGIEREDRRFLKGAKP